MRASAAAASLLALLGAAIPGLATPASGNDGEAGALALPADGALALRAWVGPLASDGRMPARRDELVTVPCGNPLVPLGQQYRLQPDCRPDGVVSLPLEAAVAGSALVEPAASAVAAMLAEAEADGLLLLVVSSYRSYEDQERLFAFWVSQVGESEALRASARPGHSEHQLGTTVDVSCARLGFGLDPAFGETPEGTWLGENASRFGFVLSYPEGMEDTTGYVFEPWHFRYVGVEVASQIADAGITVIEFLAARFEP